MTDFLRERLRRRVWRGEFLSGGVTKLFIGFAVLMLVRWQKPLGYHPEADIAAGWLMATILFAVYSTTRITNDTMRMIDDILAGRGMDVDSIDDVKLPLSAGGMILEKTGVMQMLRQLFIKARADELAKTIDTKGRVVYRTRGKDPRGPAKGVGAATFGEVMKRVDAMTARPELEGIEGELTKTEKMVEEANEAAAAKAYKEWRLAEMNDPQLIEAGVEKLGDLVAMDHFNDLRNSE